jgi:hypothetical protein
MKLLAALLGVIFAGLVVWSRQTYGRVIRDVAPILEAPRMRWSMWRFTMQVDGIWQGLPVRIESVYSRPPVLYVTVRALPPWPDLEASLIRSGKIEFRAIRYGRVGKRVKARVAEGELSMSGPQDRVAIAEYFTPPRLGSLRVLLHGLEWKQFDRYQAGIGVWRRGTAHLHWKADETRDRLHKTLAQLQTMADGNAT